MLGEHPNSKMAEAENDGRVLASSHQRPMPVYDFYGREKGDLAPGMFGHINILFQRDIITFVQYIHRLIPDSLSFCPHFKEIISDNLTTYCSLS